MMFSNGRDPLYLEMGVSGVGLGAGLLQVTEGMNWPCDEAQDNTALPTP